MGHSIFISYARRASQAHAEALWRDLGGETGNAFLDTSGIEPEDKIPRELVDALLGARVVVILASEDYFRRWYCLWELEAVLAPFLALEPTATEAQKEAALGHVFVVLPAGSTAVPDLSSLPPALRSIHWPTVDPMELVARRVLERAARVSATLQERLEQAGALGASLRTRLLEENALPHPANLALVPVYPASLPSSLEASFVGRADELWRIHYTLSVMRNMRGEGVAGAALSGALHSAGGFGKTRLALEYLYRFGPKEHPGGLFWINAEVDSERLEQQFHGILRLLDPGVPELVRLRELKRDVTQELAGALGRVAAQKRVLYVVDNVPEPRPGERHQPLRTWCPALGKVSVLVTSRARLDLGTEKLHALAIAPLPLAAAVTLLTEGVTQRLDAQEWERIADWVGCLPIALELLNRALKVGGVDASELLLRMERQSPTRELDQQMKLLEEHVPAGSLRGVTEVFSLSYERLSPEAQLAALLIAYMAPEPIPSKLLDALGEEVMPLKARVALTSRHFVTPVMATGAVPMLGVMHRLLADYLRTQAPRKEEVLRLLCVASMGLMSSGAIENSMAWPLLDTVFPHASAVFEEMMKTLPVPPGDTAEAQRVLRLGVQLSEFFLSKGFVKRAREVNERLVRLALDYLGEKHPYTLGVMSNLAMVVSEQGRLDEARVQQENVLEVMRRVLGEKHPDTLGAMANLALTFYRQGRHEEARIRQEMVLELMKQVLGEEHPDTLDAMNNLAVSLESQGRYKDAWEQQKTVLDVRKRTLGEEHLDTLGAMNNLVAVLGGQGNHKAAQEQVEQMLEVCTKVLGEGHRETLCAMSNLAAALRGQGKLEEARVWIERALALRTQTLGEEHPDTLRTMADLATNCFDQNKYEEARVRQEKVLESMKRVMGEENPITLRVIKNLAATLGSQGKHEAAREQMERVLDVCTRVWGEEHLETLSSMSNLAAALRGQGKLEEARAWLEKSLALRQRTLGEEHPDALRTMADLAANFFDQNKYEEARIRQEKVLESMKRVIGEENPTTLGMISKLAEILVIQGNHEAAQEHLEQVLEVRRRVLGEGHLETLSTMNNLAVALGGQGKMEEAGRWLEKLLALSRQILGEGHLDTLSAMNNLAVTYQAQGRLWEALATGIRLLENSRKVLGNTHTDTLTTQKNLANLRRLLGDEAGAQALEEELKALQHPPP